MNKKTYTLNNMDRWSYLWLVIGVILLTLSTGGFRVAFAAWLAPAFLIRFFRTQKFSKGYGLSLLGLYIALALGWWGVLAPMFPLPVYLIFIILVALQYSLPYLADRLISPRIQGFMVTLVYPTAATTVFLLYNLVSPMGSFGTVGYEQYNNLALIQIVSVTGLWGLTFLVSWCGPVIVWAWERSFEWQHIRSGLAVFGGVVGVVLLFGGLRLALSEPKTGTVRVHSLSVEVAFPKPDIETELDAYRRVTQEEHERFIQESIYQASRGAQLVLWPEMAAQGIPEDIDRLIARGKEVARQEGIYLAMGLDIKYPGQDKPWENKILLIDSSGEVVLDHDKYGATLLYGMLGAGPAKQGVYTLQTVDTPYGKISGVVCWDADFPMTVKQAGKQKADILLVANGDARGPQAKLHMQQHVFRAIENGLSLVRHDAHAGYSVATDPYGRVLAMVDMSTAAEPVMIGQVQTKGVATIYPIIGDLFGWLSTVGFIVMAVGVVITDRREGTT